VSARRKNGTNNVETKAAKAEMNRSEAPTHSESGSSCGSGGRGVVGGKAAASKGGRASVSLPHILRTCQAMLTLRAFYYDQPVILGLDHRESQLDDREEKETASGSVGKDTVKRMVLKPTAVVGDACDLKKGKQGFRRKFRSTFYPAATDGADEKKFDRLLALYNSWDTARMRLLRSEIAKRLDESFFHNTWIYLTAFYSSFANLFPENLDAEVGAILGVGGDGNNGDDDVVGAELDRELLIELGSMNAAASQAIRSIVAQERRRNPVRAIWMMNVTEIARQLHRSNLAACRRILELPAVLSMK
jgi:hypothetical protein